MGEAKNDRQTPIRELQSADTRQQEKPAKKKSLARELKPTAANGKPTKSGGDYGLHWNQDGT
jgi:hypothetical protein